MPFLTIEKYSRKSSSSTAGILGFGSKMLGLLLLVVPFIIVAAWFLFGSIIVSTQAASGINKQINYQGRIADSDGASVASGSYNFKFEIYANADGGSSLWSEEWSDTSDAGAISIINGSFSAPLGTSTSLSAVDFNDDSLYLQVYFDPDGDGTFEEIFTPRKRLTASPYAMNADMTDGIHATTTATANQLLALDAQAGLSLNAVTTTDSFYATGVANFNSTALFAGAATFNSQIFGTTARLATLNATTTNVGSLLVYNNADINGYASTTLGLFTVGNGHIGGALTVDGNVGIGDSAPTEKLSVSLNQNNNTLISVTNSTSGTLAVSGLKLNTDYATGGVYLTSASYTAGAGYSHLSDRLLLSAGADADGVAIVSNQPTSDISFYTGGASLTNRRMKIDADGRIGIATSTPGGYYGEMFTVNGNTLLFGAATTTHTLSVGGYASSTGGLFTQGDLHVGGLTTFDGLVSGAGFSTAWANAYNATTTLNGFNPEDYVAASDFAVEFASAYNATTTLNGFTNNQANWNTAFGWGDHALGGYASSTGLFAKLEVSEFSSYFTTNFNATDLITHGRLSVLNATTTNTGDLTVYGGITLGGEYRTAWPEASVTGNLFDQWLDTTSTPTFVGLNASTTNIGTLTVYAGGSFNSITTTDSLYVGGYASSTGGLFTEGNMHVGGTASFDGLISGAGFSTAWANAYNATTTLNGFNPASYLSTVDFASEFADAYNSTTTLNGFTPANYLLLSDFSTQFNNAYNATTTLNGFTNNQGNWNTAFGWGDHASAGYATSSGLFTKLAVSEFSSYFTTNFNSTDLMTHGRLSVLNATTTNIGTLNVYGGGSFNSITTTDSFYVGGYASSTGGLFTQGNVHSGGNGSFDGSVGIGTNNPTQLVHLSSASDQAMRFETQASTITSGPNSPATAADDSSLAGSQWTWSNTGNIFTSNNSKAQVSLASTSNSYAHYLKATNFSFNIPSTAVIQGIKVEVEKSASSNDLVSDKAVRIIKGGTIGSTDKSSGAAWTTTDTYASYGGTSDLWGETWTAADINSSNFGFAISAQADNIRIAYVDHIKITVYYSNGIDWAIGSDYSDNSSFKISRAAALGSNDYVSITTSGNFGIATTTPGGYYGEKLTVNGNSLLFGAATTTRSLYVGSYATSTGGLFTQGNLHVGGAADIDSTLTLRNELFGTTGRLSVLNASTTNVGALTVYDNSLFNTATFSGEVIGSAARLAVVNATTTNIGDLHVYGTLTYDGDLSVTSGTITVINATTTNVGTLTAYGNSTIEGYASSTSLYVGINGQTATSTWIRGGMIVDQTPGGVPTLAVNASENFVGIGTSNPKTPLDVVGIIRTDDIVSTLYGLYNNVNYNNGYKYRSDGTAFAIAMQPGVNYMSLQYAAAGTTGNAVTFADGLKLNSDGHVIIPNLRATSLNASTTNIGTLTVYAGGSFNSVTTTDSLYVGGYASSTGGLFTQGNMHVGGTASFDGLISGAGFSTAWANAYNATTTLNGFAPANYVPITWAGYSDNRFATLNASTTNVGTLTVYAGGSFNSVTTTDSLRVGGLATFGGRVGIATTTPGGYYGEKLTVDDSANIMRSTGGMEYLFNVGTTTSANLFTVKSSGNVGIGTMAPGAKLDVRGSIFANQLQSASIGNGTLQNLIANSENVGAFTIYSGSSAVIAGGAPNGDDVYEVTTGTGLIRRTLTVAAATSHSISFWVKIISGTVTFNSDLGDASNGITSPTFTGSSEWQRFTYSGTTGAAPGQYLDFQFTAGTVVQIWAPQVNTGLTVVPYIKTTGTAVSSATSFLTSVNNSMYVTGNVGIATTTPGGYYGEKLTVVDSANIMRSTGGTEYLFNVGTTTANNLFTVKSSGNIGIGINPATILDIDTGSNTLGLRLRGLAETTEIADMFVRANGALVLTTENTGASAGYIEVDPEDNQFGFIIRDGNTGGGTSGVYANLYTVNSAGEDYLAINVDQAVGDAFVITDGNKIGIATTTPGGYLGEKLTVNGASLFYGGQVNVNNLADSSGIGINNSGNGNYSYVAFTRERNSGPSVGGASIRLQSNTVDNSSKLFIGSNTSMAYNGSYGSYGSFNTISSALAGGATITLGRSTNATSTELQINLTQLDSSSADVIYSQIKSLIVDPDPASEDGNIALSVMKAGTLTEAMRIDNLGNIGIATSTPGGYYGEKLTVVDSANIMRSTGGTEMLFNVGTTTSANILSVKSSGKVGIGTALPQQLLEVSGAGANVYLVQPSGNAPSTVASSQKFVVVQGNVNPAATPKALGRYAFASNDTSFVTTPRKTVAWIGAEGEEAYVADNDAASALVFATAVANAGTGDDVATERMRLNSSGYLGIGTSTPQAILDVSVTAGTSVYPAIFQALNASSNGAIAFNLGTSVGPRILGNTLTDGNVSVAAKAAGISLGGNGFQVLTSDETTGARVWDTRLTVEAINGGVGIATTTPGGYYGEKLTVTGGAYVTANLNVGSTIIAGSGGITLGGVNQTAWPSGSSQWTTTGSNIYYDTGSVGIATTTPGGYYGEKLTVVGAEYVTSNSIIGGYSSSTAGLFTQGNGHFGGTFSVDKTATTTGNFTAGTVYIKDGKLGIGTQTVTYDFTIDGQSNRTIGINRYSGSDYGRNITIQAGGGSSGGANKNGGNAYISGGISTGAGSSQIAFLTATPVTTGPVSTHALGDGGSGYSIDDVLDIYDEFGTGTGGQITVSGVDGSGTITNYNLTNAGTGYSVSGLYPLNCTGECYGFSAMISVNTVTTEDDDNTPTTKMIIDGSGNVGIGVSPTYKFQVNGQPAANGYTAFTNYSDARLKNNIEYLGSGYLDKIMQLRPATFNYNGLTGYDEEAQGREITGFIAQDMLEIFPDMVGTKKINGTDYYDANLSSLQIYLVKAVQEQQRLINVLASSTASTTVSLATIISDQMDSLKVELSRSSGSLTVSENLNPNMQTLTVEQSATFYGTLTVVGEASFEHKVVFNKDVEVKGKLYLSEDQAGTLTIPMGGTSTEMLFKGAYEFVPMITASPHSRLGGRDFWISDKSTTTFRLNIDPAADSQLIFDWIAIPVKGQVAGAADAVTGTIETVAGCTSEGATNYNPVATQDDGSCSYPAPAGNDAPRDEATPPPVSEPAPEPPAEAPADEPVVESNNPVVEEPVVEQPTPEVVIETPAPEAPAVE